MTLQSPTRILITDISFDIKPQSLTAILGLGGIGPSTILNYIAGQKTGNITVKGEVTINDEKREPHKWSKQVGYVEATFYAFTYETVYENIFFVGKMQQTTHLVEPLIQKLELEEIRDMYIENLSIDERKLVAIAVELAADPDFIILDEPTANLDSFTAYKIIRMLEDIARKDGKTILISIHQPTMQMSLCFDSIIVLHKDKILFDGSIKKCKEFYKFAGYNIKDDANVCEKFIEALGNDKKRSKLNDNSYKEILEYKKEWDFIHNSQKSINERSEPRSNFTGSNIATYSLRRKIIRNFSVCFTSLYIRYWHNLTRNHYFVRILVIERIIFLIFICISHVGLGYSNDIVGTRMGIISYLIINTIFSIANPVLNVYPIEGPALRRERMNGFYNGGIAFLSRIVAMFFFIALVANSYIIVVYWVVGFNANAGTFFIFLAIICSIILFSIVFSLAISAMCTNEMVSQVIGSSLLFIFSIFAGTFTQFKALPTWIKWLIWISPINYAYRAGLLNQLKGIEFIDSSGNIVQRGEDVLATNGMDTMSLWACGLALWIFTLIYGIIGAICLHMNTRLKLD